MIIFECKISLEEWTRIIEVSAPNLEEALKIAEVRATSICGVLTAVYPVRAYDE